MTCEMYFLLMPNLIVDSPGYAPVVGESPLTSGTVVTLAWWPSRRTRESAAERVSRLNGRRMRRCGAFGAQLETFVCAGSDGGAGPPALCPWKAGACSVSLCRSAPYWQIVILSCQSRLTSTYFRARG